MNQLNLFDGIESEARKEVGISLAEANQGKPLDVARQIARELANPGGITADDVVRELVRRGYDIHCLGNSAGSLFRGGEWEARGLRKSVRVHAHSNLLRVWYLKTS